MGSVSVPDVEAYSCDMCHAVGRASDDTPAVCYGCYGIGNLMRCSQCRTVWCPACIPARAAEVSGP